MCIVASVGNRGRNDFTDGKVLQALLNQSRGRFDDPAPERLPINGRIGMRTIGVLTRFQSEVMGMGRPHRVMVAGDATYRALAGEVRPGITREKLAAIMPFASNANLDRFHMPLKDRMPDFGIDTGLRMAHFMAQIGHESGSLRFTEELASGEAYEGRTDLGNTEPGDGRRFKGRGLIQLTGRANYQAFQNDTGRDVIANPEQLATDPGLAVEVACWFWRTNDLNELADLDDLTALTRRINGGFNGLDDRQEFFARARALLPHQPEAPEAPDGP